MKIGVSQIDITPEAGGELSGFAARVQPSLGMLDPLFAKGIYVESAGDRLLWLHCDLVGIDRAIVMRFRQWALRALRLESSQVMLSATHTHSGPATIRLREAGKYDPQYARTLQSRLREAARRATTTVEEVALHSAQTNLPLAVDRRGTASAHVDPRVTALGFRRGDGSFAAAILNYAMHPVALGSSNRLISADFPAHAARRLSSCLPGRPVVLFTNGACGNLNPPAENVPPSRLSEWGQRIADAIVPTLRRSTAQQEPPLKTVNRIVQLPLDTLNAQEIAEFTRKALSNPGPLAEWGDKYQKVVRHWKSSLLRNHNSRQTHQEAELFGVRLGDTLLIGINAEVFSTFTEVVRNGTANQKLCVVGYANGDMGYLPNRAAYAEGGYEVDVAHLFYGGFRAKKGGFELLARAASGVARKLQHCV